MLKPILLAAASVLVATLAPTLVLAQDVVIRREPRPDFGAEQIAQLAVLVMALLIALRGYRYMRREKQIKREQQEQRRRREG